MLILNVFIVFFKFHIYKYYLLWICTKFSRSNNTPAMHNLLVDHGFRSEASFINKIATT